MSELASIKRFNTSTVLPAGISFHGSNQWLRGQQARNATVQALQSLPSDDVLLRLMHFFRILVISLQGHYHYLNESNYFYM